MRSFLVTVAALAAVAVGVKVTFPGEGDSWETKGSEMIEWDTVSTDPDTLKIVLIDPDNNSETVNKNISTSEGSYIYTPSGDLKEGKGYRINLVNADGGILAQSPQFNVTSGTSTVSPTSAMPSQTSGASQTSGSASSASSSSGQTSGAATPLAAPAGGLALLILGAIGALA